MKTQQNQTRPQPINTQPIKELQVGMAANLRDFVLTNCEGKEVKGLEVTTYDGAPVGYASCPRETMNYVSAHDNETLFDIVSLKTPRNISIDERCRINHLATSPVALSQGIPFFHSGDETVRSKSLDRDSYNSGDWFNKTSATVITIGVWPFLQERKTKRTGHYPSFKPQKRHILSALENFTTGLRIRYSSPLFRLRTTNVIQFQAIILALCGFL